jgi:alpha,alpha-trehalose phosphorylase
MGAIHVNADIALAVRNYVIASEDHEFEHDVGLELLVETARLWMSVGHVDAMGDSRIDWVTGPDAWSSPAAGRRGPATTGQLRVHPADASWAGSR